MIDKNTFALRLSLARRARNLTQADLAKLIHMSKQTVSNWEKAEKIPSTKTVYHLCEILNVSIDYLLGRSGENYLDVSGIQEDQVLILGALIDSLKKK